jgi:hypothetical protein
MVSLRISMEVLVISPVPHVNALVNVFCCMRVNNINDHLDSVFMGLIDKLFEFVRFSEAGGDTEEIGDVITKRTVVRMFHDAHDLDNVVTELDNFW